MIYRDVTNGINLYWSCHVSESYEAIGKDMEGLYPLLENSLPDGIISDWKNSIVASVGVYFPDAVYQRCLSHLKRETCRLLPLRSPYQATQELRMIALEIMYIYDPIDFYNWTVKTNLWIEKYCFFLKEKTIGINTKKKWWYTHGNLRSAIRLLTQDNEYIFAYLKNPFLPKTNNSLEGVNSQIKTKLGIHRGMKFNQRVSFIFWLLAFSRIKNRSDLKKLWDLLKDEFFAG